MNGEIGKFRRKKRLQGQMTEVLRSMTYLQGSELDLTRAGECWLGNRTVGSGYGRPRKSSSRI